jgi:thioredoxin 1
MAKIGFTKVYNLQRGILDWQRNSLPVVQSTAPIASTSKIYTPQSFSQFINSNKLVLVDFHAQWCAPCKQMAPIIDQLSKDYSDKVKIEKIDVEANRAIAEANQIQSIPGFILYKNGQQVWLHKGMISHADLSQVLNQHL